MRRIISMCIALVCFIGLYAQNQEYDNTLRMCNNIRTRIDRQSGMGSSAFWKNYDNRVVMWKQWREQALKGLFKAKKEENQHWEYTFLEQMYYMYWENGYLFDKEYQEKKALDYAKKMVNVAVKVQNCDTICFAISHYLYVSKEYDKCIQDILPYMKRAVTPNEYKTITCFIARQLVNLKDTVNAKKMLKEAMGLHLAKNNNEAMNRRIILRLINNGNLKEAANTYMGLLESEKNVKNNEERMKSNEQERSRTELNNAFLIFVLVCIICITIGCGTYLHKRNQQKENGRKFEISRLKGCIDKLNNELEQVKNKEADNYLKIRKLEKKIEAIQTDITTRLSIGKSIYVAIENNKHLPSELKGAESYLIDYVMVYNKEIFKRWKSQYESLTPHMYTYLILRNMGKTNDEIEEILCISSSSLRSLRSRIEAKRKS